MPRPYSQATDSERGELLVAILNRPADLEIVEEQGWYRIPVASAPKRWPPQWLAFYQTKIFRDDAYQVNWYGKIREIRQVARRELLPDEPQNDKSDRRYYQVFLESLERRPQPIPSLRLRRIVFIPTTLAKFQSAREINDLYDDSPLEDRLWAELKRLGIPAERQMDITVTRSRFVLDFAVYCITGKIDLEADGDAWHADRERIPKDNARNNALESNGWHVLRFNGKQIREQMAEYCVPQVVQMVNRLGGLSDEVPAPTLTVSGDGIAQQMRLFEDRPAYGEDKT
jgi:very-short-patch-repair endonuclease